MFIPTMMIHLPATSTNHLNIYCS